MNNELKEWYEEFGLGHHRGPMDGSGPGCNTPINHQDIPGSEVVVANDNIDGQQGDIPQVPPTPPVPPEQSGIEVEIQRIDNQQDKRKQSNVSLYQAMGMIDYLKGQLNLLSTISASPEGQGKTEEIKNQIRDLVSQINNIVNGI